MTARRRTAPVNAGDSAYGEGRLQETPTLWSRRAGRQLSAEDEREIAANLTGFFRVLAAWSEESGGGSSQSAPPQQDTH